MKKYFLSALLLIGSVFFLSISSPSLAAGITTSPTGFSIYPGGTTTHAFSFTNNTGQPIVKLDINPAGTGDIRVTAWNSGCDSVEQIDTDWICHTTINDGQTKNYSITFSLASNGTNSGYSYVPASYWFSDGSGAGWSPSVTVTTAPTPTPAPDTMAVSPSSTTLTVGTPFNATIVVSGGQSFNAAGATVAISSNLTVSALHNATSNACNFQYTQTPTTNNASFAGAIYGSSSSSCTVYTLTLTPNAAGTGSITITNGQIKSYSDSSEILSGVTNASFTINNQGATPTPTAALSQVTVTSPLETYNTSYNLSGTKDSAITSVFVNGSSTGVTYPTSTTWQATETLSLGNNVFTLYGSDGTNQTATQNVTVSRHTLGDINGDTTVDLTDASLFAVDYGKTSNLTYLLSDMNNDGTADLTDLSILAKLETQ